MNRQDLRLRAVISTSSIAKLGKGENITTDVLFKSAKPLIATSYILETDKSRTDVFKSMGNS